MRGSATMVIRLQAWSDRKCILTRINSPPSRISRVKDASISEMRDRSACILNANGSDLFDRIDTLEDDQHPASQAR